MLKARTKSCGARIVTAARVYAITAILFELAITGCAALSHVSDAGTGRTTIPVAYQDASGNTLSINSQPTGATIWLGALPGAIFGRAYDPLKTESITTPPTLELDLGELRELAAKRSMTLTAAASVAGWKIVPADTRLIRIATNLDYTEPHRQLPSTRFADLQSDEILLLVYFDRPCQLTGNIAEPGESDSVNVTVGKAGLHWLEVTRGATEREYVIHHASETITPIFVATLPP